MAASGRHGAQPRPTQGASEPIGSYSRGCAAGLVALPETGPTWQAMRLKRNRFWGQPELVAYLQDLSAFAATLPQSGANEHGRQAC